MDRIAQDLALDPVAVRRRNLIGADQFPYTTPNGNIHGSGDYQALLDKALVNVGYDERSTQADGGASVRAERRAGGASASASASSSASSPAAGTPRATWRSFPQSKQMPGAGGVEGATVKIEKNGSVVFTLGSPSCGQSHETTACTDHRRRARRAAGADRARRRRSTRRCRRGACRPPTAATTSISTTSAPFTARRRGFGRRC